MAIGRLDQSADELKRAEELDPLSMYINANVGFRLYFARQYDQAIDHWRKTLQLDPNFPLPHSYLSMAYEQKHLYKEAVEEAEKALALGGSPTNIASLGHVYRVMGKTQKAREQLRILRERSKQTFVPAFYIAYIYVGLGDADQSFQWLDRACKEHSGYLVDLKMDPSFDPVRGDPRFTALLQRLHFPI
jgi:tetratricopeptide (TPR) repeat protein